MLRQGPLSLGKQVGQKRSDPPGFFYRHLHGTLYSQGAPNQVVNSARDELVPKSCHVCDRKPLAEAFSESSTAQQPVTDSRMCGRAIHQGSIHQSVLGKPDRPVRN